jgi:hypothetical protein
MSQSARFIARQNQGVVRHNWFWHGVITTFSTVSITAGEVGVGGSQQPPPGAIGQDFFYHLGAASIWVSNVCPYGNLSNGGVEFLLHVDWDTPLDVAITVTVEDSFPALVQGFGIH